MALALLWGFRRGAPPPAEAATGLRARMQRAHGGSVGASTIDPVALAVRANCGRNTIFPCFLQGQRRDYPWKVMELSLRREKCKFTVLL